jgi:hypothetical protein
MRIVIMSQIPLHDVIFAVPPQPMPDGASPHF